MRILFISAWALGALTSLALAEEPVALTDAQMDAVTAGQVSYLTQNLTQISSAIAIGGAGGDGGRGGDANGDFDCGSCDFGGGDFAGQFAGAGGLGGDGGDGGNGGSALAIAVNSASMTQTITR